MVAIPLEEWSLDYIKPKPMCIRKGGTCIQSTYPNPPESKKIQFEQEVDVEGGQKHATYKFSNTTTYILLNHKDDMIDLRGKVPNPGTYIFVVQYFQPDYPGNIQN